jgi:purine catabolism regulator
MVVRRPREEWASYFREHWLPQLRAGGVNLQVLPVYIDDPFIPELALRETLRMIEAAHGTELARKVRRVLLQEERERLLLRLCAGIGRPHQGTSGLQLSLHEADQAYLLAGTQDESGAVEHIDAMNLKRHLVGWYASGPLREVAAELLQPLWTADPAGDLVRTLGCYLDHESSATTTAIVLGVHRKTVLHRLDRIRGLLAADLNRPDERLVAHLATRVAGIEDHGEFGGDPV